MRAPRTTSLGRRVHMLSRERSITRMYRGISLARPNSCSRRANNVTLSVERAERKAHVPCKVLLRPRQLLLRRHATIFNSTLLWLKPSYRVPTRLPRHIPGALRQQCGNGAYVAGKRENLPSQRVTFEKRVEGKGHRRGHEIRMDGAPRGIYDGIQQ